MVLKKIVSMILDILFAIIAVLPVSLYLNESLKLTLYKIVFIYFIHTNILSYFSKQYTIGERWVRIGLKRLDETPIPFKILFARNLILSFLIFLIAISWGSLFETILFGLSFVSMNMISTNNKFQKPMTPLDFVFKTYYTNV